MEDSSTPSTAEPSWEEKRLWLYDHGYMNEVNGMEYLSSEAVARLGCNAANAGELSHAAKTGRNDLFFAAISRLREGAGLMRDIYETSDPVEILFAAFSAEEASKR